MSECGSTNIDNSQKSGCSGRRILVLTTSYPSDENDPSGIFIAKLLGAIRKRGYFVKVVAPSSGTFYGHRLIHGVETLRFGYFLPHSLERLTRGGGGIPENMAGSLLARVQLAPMMLRFVLAGLSEAPGSDIIYANWLGAGLVGAVINFITRKPLVVSFRGDDGYLARDRPLWRALTKWVTARSAAVAPVSAALLEIIKSLGVPDDKCFLPRFGVDTEMFHPPKAPRKEDLETRILFVGSLIVRKGLHDLLEALADPAFRRVKLIVVGEGSYGPQLNEMCGRLGLTDRTEWRGTLPPLDVAELMRSSDILCLPSYMEGRPNAVNEAMASGLPVVTTRIGGIPDMVEEGRTAFLFDPGNVEELRGYLLALVSAPDLRKKMGQAGRDMLIRTGVSWDSTAEEFDSLFSRITGKPPDNKPSSRS
jgi:glycosyltransferase involved in cell wall biosynthesis